MHLKLSSAKWWPFCPGTYELTDGFIASATESPGWGKGGEGMIDGNEMFKLIAAASWKPKVLFSYLGCQPNKFLAFLVPLYKLPPSLLTTTNPQQTTTTNTTTNTTTTATITTYTISLCRSNALECAVW